MAAQHSDTPAWLFSFVDLAFLILLAMTQVGSLDSAKGLDLGELIVPRVGENGPAEALETGAAVTQVRVYPPGDGLPVFELVASGGSTGVRMDRDALRERLSRLRAGSADRPVLAPHADSRSEDLLTAVSLVEDTWPSNRRATVQRIEAPR